MNLARTTIISILMILFLLSAGGCNKALVYSEGTNLSLASVKLNDNVAEPISVNLGFDRTVAAMAPPRGDVDDTVNMVSAFRMDQDSSGISGTLTINSEFASGDAATASVEGDAEAAMSILSLTAGPPPAPDLAGEIGRAIAHVKASDDGDAVKRVADRMGVGGGLFPQNAIVTTLHGASPGDFQRYSAIIVEELGPY